MILFGFLVWVLWVAIGLFVVCDLFCSLVLFGLFVLGLFLLP